MVFQDPMPKRLTDFKQLIDETCTILRKLQSPETGFLHPASLVQGRGQQSPAIPFYENLLFCLALFRTKESDNISEARNLLIKLLSYQNLNPDSSSRGNFPCYLHEFPFLSDPYCAIKALAPLNWIVSKFFSSLPDFLGGKLKEAIAAATAYADRVVEQKEQVPPWVLFRLGRKQPTMTNLSPINLSHSLIYSCQADQEIPDSLKDLLEITWHPSLGCYVGPSYDVEFFEGSPRPTYYDCFLNYLSGTQLRELQRNSIDLVKNALIPVSMTTFEPKTEFSCPKWKIFKGKNWGLTVPIDPDSMKSCQPICFMTANDVIEWYFPSNTTLIAADCTSSSAKLELEVEPKDEQEEVCGFDIFVANAKETSITVKGQKATIFNEKDPICIHQEKASFSFSFQKLTGEGVFFGHIEYTNRPQETVKEKYATYAKHLFLRHVKGAGKTRLSISFEAKDVA